MWQAPWGPCMNPPPRITPSACTTDLFVDTSLSTWTVPPAPRLLLFLCPVLQETFPPAPLPGSPWVTTLSCPPVCRAAVPPVNQELGRAGGCLTRSVPRP